MNTEKPQAVEVAGLTHIASVAAPADTGSQPEATAAATGNADFRANLLSAKPLPRPNRTRPPDVTEPKSAAERLVPSREELRKIRDALPFPAGWHEEDEKPF
jgi:hypothetical protein